MTWLDLIRAAFMHAAHISKHLRRKRLPARRATRPEIVDRSGKVLGTLVPTRAKPQFPKLWTIVFEDFLLRAAMSQEFEKIDYRVLMLLAVELAGRPWKPVKQDALASQLGTTQSTVSRSLRRLVDAGILERKNRGGVTGAAEYRLNHGLIWRGNATNWWITDRQRQAEQADVTEQPDADGVLPEPEA